MSDQTPQTDPRILLTAVQQMDRIARRFRRKLRDAAVELSGDAGHSVPIGPDTIAEAVPLVCRELLSDAGSHLGDERGSDGQRPRAA